jgi:hypothetical protein
MEKPQEQATLLLVAETLEETVAEAMTVSDAVPTKE